MNKRVIGVLIIMLLITTILPLSATANEITSTADDVEIRIVVGSLLPNIFPINEEFGRAIGFEVKNNRSEPITVSWTVSCDSFSGKNLFLWNLEETIEAGPGRVEYYLINRLYFNILDKTKFIFRITIDVECEDLIVSGSATGILNWVILDK